MADAAEPKIDTAKAEVVAEKAAAVETPAQPVAAAAPKAAPKPARKVAAKAAPKAVAKTVKPVIDRKPNGNPTVVLNFITPHQKWGIHSTYSDNLLLLTMSRGGPIVWISEVDAKDAGIVDNDWVEAFNSNGALVARAVVSQRVKQGICLMYHAQEKLVNTPGSEQTGQRGGIHNSVTRAVLKPTHMIGGYAQQSYGFNYYGTVGSNRDEFVIVRKVAKVDWLERPFPEAPRMEAAE